MPRSFVNGFQTTTAVPVITPSTIKDNPNGKKAPSFQGGEYTDNNTTQMLDSVQK